ncbi:ead/Ea22-like family protein [Escherichia coli]
MTIDYQALREAAERAIPAMERLLMLPVDDDLISEQELKDYGVDIDALNAFKFLAGPETVLALLDERERNQQYIKRRDQENEDIALTVGKLLIENGRLVADTLRHLADNEIDSDYFAITSTNENGTEIDHEMAITDYALQAAGTVDELVAALEAAEKRIAELEAEPVSQTYKSQHTQFEQVADLYEMQFDDGRTCAFHTDAQKAAQWLQACDGNRVQEYVKLERLQNALSGNSPVTPDGWISCSERMPEDTTMLLAFSQGEIVAAYWNWVVNPIDYKKYRAFTYLSGNILDDVTHWMLLPEPPL